MATSPVAREARQGSAPASAPRKKVPFWQRLSFQESTAGYVFIGPWLIGLLGLTLFPMIFSFVMGFYRWDIINDPVFIGLDNFKELFKDRLFWISLRQTVYYATARVPLMLVAGLVLAVLLNQKVKGLGFFRTAFYLPSVIPDVAVLMMWIWLLSPQGLVNQLLGKVGIHGPNWFGSTDWAVPALILTGMWGVGGGMLVYLGGLQGIPTQLYEAAEIDGAGRFRQFWHVTLPMISPVLFYNLVTGIIGAMQAFTGSFIATAGGPGYATHFLVYYLYNNAFGYLKMGFASAFAWVVFAIIMVLTLVVFRFSSAWVYYEGLRSKK